jgi:hypothetical protein
VRSTKANRSLPTRAGEGREWERGGAGKRGEGEGYRDGVGAASIWRKTNTVTKNNGDSSPEKTEINEVEKKIAD